MIYPSVTQVLSPFVDFSAIPEHVLANASARGSEVHRICSILARGVPFMDSVPEDCAGYVESFIRWFEMVEAVYGIEEELIEQMYGYVAHPDLVVRMRGDKYATVVDLKTPAVQGKTWSGQLSAYLNAWNGLHPDKRARRALALQLDPDGKLPKVREYMDDKRDFAAFVAALTAYKFFHA